jgi:transcriptional regulator with XRE-family HTH domain
MPWLEGGDMGEHWREALKSAREQLGLSQAELARRASLSREAVRGYEEGRRRPSSRSLSRLLDALQVDAATRNEILVGMSGLAPTLFPSQQFPNYFYTVEELQQAVEDAPWPEFVLNDNVEVVAANAAVQALWGVDFAEERRQRSRAQMNLLSVASTHRFADHALNWDQCLATLAGVFKGRPRDPRTLDEPDAYFNAVLAEFSAGDPTFLRRLIDVFASAPARDPKCRWTYRVVWRDDDFGEMRFTAIVNTASEPDALAFNDWVPLDAESWTALEQVKERRRR